MVFAPGLGCEPLDVTDHALLLLLAGFQVKHLLGDYVFQSPYILENRRIWGHPGGLLHVAIHAALTLPLLLLAGVHGWLFLALLLGEAVFHYHVDFVKDGLIYRAGWTVADKQYWWVTGIDQMLHQLSYLLIAGVIAY
ncbi:MAG: DUF3307 domain-containing protein [Hyphomicrobiales bacterium]